MEPRGNPVKLRFSSNATLRIPQPTPKTVIPIRTLKVVQDDPPPDDFSAKQEALRKLLSYPANQNKSFKKNERQILGMLEEIQRTIEIKKKQSKQWTQSLFNQDQLSEERRMLSLIVKLNQCQRIRMEQRMAVLNKKERLRIAIKQINFRIQDHKKRIAYDLLKIEEANIDIELMEQEFQRKSILAEDLRTDSEQKSKKLERALFYERVITLQHLFWKRVGFNVNEKEKDMKLFLENESLSIWDETLSDGLHPKDVKCHIIMQMHPDCLRIFEGLSDESDAYLGLLCWQDCSQDIEALVDKYVQSGKEFSCRLVLAGMDITNYTIFLNTLCSELQSAKSAVLQVHQVKLQKEEMAENVDIASMIIQYSYKWRGQTEKRIKRVIVYWMKEVDSERLKAYMADKRRSRTVLMRVQVPNMLNQQEMRKFTHLFQSLQEYT